jgi:hypothetical protein
VTRKTDRLPEGVLVLHEEWSKLSPVGKQFLVEAAAGHFCYQAEDGEVCAWGAPGTANLFSMSVNEIPQADGSSLYTLNN